MVLLARRVLVWGARWAVPGCVAVVAMEVTVRVEDRIANGVPFMSRVASAADLVVVDSGVPHGRAGARLAKWHMNRLGFRGPDVDRAQLMRGVRVVVEGASETFGLYESPGREYPRQLEDSLRGRVGAACGPSAARREYVLNGGLAGMAMPSMIRHVAGVVAPLHPQVIVLYPSPAFYVDVKPPRPAPITASVLDSLPLRNALRPRILNRLRDQVKALLPTPVLTLLRERAIRNAERAHPPEWKLRSIPDERKVRFEEDLRSLVGGAKATGATVVLMLHVNETLFEGFDDRSVLVSWEHQFPNATGEVLEAFHRWARTATARVAADSGVSLVDPLPSLASRWRESFADFVHFTDTGASVIAGVLAAAIWQENSAVRDCPGAAP